MKRINENTKVTLTLGQLKKLVRESVEGNGDFEIKGDVLVKYCGNEDYVDVPNGVKEIGNEAFRKSRVVTVTIPYSVTSIGENAFYGCSNLASVSIPRSVTSIGGGAFNGCSKLEVVDIPGSVGSIKKYTFCGCTNLESVILPKSTARIEDWAFQGCTKLTDINIPEGAEVEPKAFYQCKFQPEIVAESYREDNNYFYIPLGLNADENLAKMYDAEVKGNPSPTSIIDDLYGQLSDGRWENSPSMKKWWIAKSGLVDDGGELTLKIKKEYYLDLGYGSDGYSNTATNPYLDFDGKPEEKKVKEWMANHLKILVQDEVGKQNWKRDNDMELSYFDTGTTVAMVYAVYDILKGRPQRGKNDYYDVFIA